ncbi:MAG: hypothetical protein ACF8GE_02000 [Phycisphaerales bacterium JB043]
MTESSAALPEHIEALMRQAVPLLEGCACFASSSLEGDRLSLLATETPEPVFFYLSYEDGRLWGGMATPDRWLSQSIEADLVHTGDSLVELIEEELADLGCALSIGGIEHFRDERMRYTFRSALPEAISASDASLVLRAFDAAFRELGDMKETEDE